MHTVFRYKNKDNGCPPPNTLMVCYAVTSTEYIHEMNCTPDAGTVTDWSVSKTKTKYKSIRIFISSRWLVRRGADNVLN